MGKGWRNMTDRHGRGYFPNINEIKSGVQKESKYFGALETGALMKLLDSIPQTYDREMPIKTEYLKDPNNPFVVILLQMYSLRVITLLNLSIRKGDESKFETLGPYSQALHQVVSEAF
jgi:hypothetical protein